ncbi:MAG TPA: hypothetical protein VHG89_04265 [Verrucomicrobiae bacterium]|nr:hypothetical protein [Verrucomicrobiae bacterium]
MNHFNQRYEGTVRAAVGSPHLVTPQVKDFLNLIHPPGRFNVAQAAARLGFKAHDIPILVARGFLKPLGHPKPNAEKYFARELILELERNEAWLSRATDALSQYWQNKNAAKRNQATHQTMDVVRMEACRS